MSSSAITCRLVDGGAGRDALLIRTAGLVDVSRVSGVEFYQLAGNGSSVMLTNANFPSVQYDQIGVVAVDGGATLDGSAVT